MMSFLVRHHAEGIGARGARTSGKLVSRRCNFNGQKDYSLESCRRPFAIGGELSGEDGDRSCQLSCLNAIAQIRQAVGELSKVRRIVRLEGTMWVDESFKEHPKCLNGASDLINEAFGDKGQHTRMIYTNPVMPFDCTSLVVLYAEI